MPLRAITVPDVHEHAPIQTLAGPGLRGRLAAVPGVHLLETASGLDPGTIWVLDAALATSDQAENAIVLVDDPDAAVRWLEAGALEVLLTNADLEQTLPAAVRRARARRRHRTARGQPERRYRALVEYALDVTTIIDGMGTIEYESPSISSVLGYEPEELVGRNGLELVHPSDVPKLLQLLVEGRDDPLATATAAYRMRHKDGSWRHLESRAVNRLHDPAVRGIIVVSRDISARTAAEQALAAERSRLKALLQAIPDAFVLIDRNGIYQEVHLPAGYESVATPAQMVGRSIHEVLPADLARRAMQSVEEALASGLEKRFAYRIDIEGQARYRDARVVPFDDRVALSMQRDVTDRVQALEQIRLSEARFRTLFEASPDAIFVESLSGDVLDANPAACALHRAELKWLVGRNVVDLVPEPYRSRVRSALPRIAAGDLSEGEGYSLTTDGEAVPVEFRVARIEFGDAPALLLHVTDITARREAERLIRRLSARQHLVIEEERRRISRDVHDVLGQSLTGIQLSLARLQRAADPAAAAELGAVRDSVKDAIEDVRRIASDLRPTILDDLGLLAALEWYAAHLSERAGLRTTVEMASGDLVADGERSITLYRVVQELLTNVARHAGATQAVVRLDPRPDKLVLEVEDDGCGFKPDPGSHSLGIRGIRERLARWDGTLIYHTPNGGGTLARVQLPLTD